jgi:Tol biopolymer transport system component
MRPVQLTASPGLDAFPALSPDGQLIAYASNRGGSFEIVVRALAGSGEERAVTSDGLQNVQPAWSPDGAFIAYHSRRRGGIWATSALGGGPRQISRFGSRPAWSPDGARIAFQSDPYIDLSPTGYAANIPSTIWTAARDGTDARAVTRAAAPIGAHGSPTWSPDGARIVFVTAAAGPLRVWTVAAGGGIPALIDGLEGSHDLTLAPDGRTIYAATGGPTLKRVAVSPETGLADGTPETILVPGVSSVRHVSLSRDGSAIAFAGMELTSQLWTLPMAGEAASAPPTRLTEERTTRQTEPAFSPDGKALAFWSVRPGAGAEIWIVGAEGGRASPVTIRDQLFNPTSYTRPSWIPGGRQLAFLSHEDPIVRSVTFDLDSRRETTLLEVAALEDPKTNSSFTARDLTLAPDGTRAAYSQVDPATGRPRLFVRPLSEPLGRPLTSGLASERYPVWSPDGRLLAYEIKQDDATNIAIVGADGSRPRTLTATTGENWPYGWSPDGDKVLFAALRGGLWNLWWVSIATGDTRQLTRNESANVFLRYPAWSPRGDRIAYELGTVTGNVWIAPLPH